MRRKLTNFARVASLLLSVAVVALWVRSHAVMDLVSRTTTHGTPLDGGSRECGVRSNLGELVVVIHPYEYHRTTPPALDEDDGWIGDPALQPLRWTSADVDPQFAVRHTTVHPPYGHNAAGFAYGRYASPVSRSPDGSWSQRWQYTSSAPHWFVALALAFPAAARAFRRHRRRRRDAAGSCQGCGYDLRASPDRCPECGTVPKPPHPTPTQRPATA
jgi:hypothetical protein